MQRYAKKTGFYIPLQMTSSPSANHKIYTIVIILAVVATLTSCSYSHTKVEYPIDFKYAFLSSIEYSGINDTLKSAISDSIISSISRAGLILIPIDSIKSDSLLIIKADVIKKGAGIGITLSFYPQGGNKFTEIYFSGAKKDEPIATIHAQSTVPFSDEYNFKRAIEILNNGLITDGGTKNLF